MGSNHTCERHAINMVSWHSSPSPSLVPMLLYYRGKLGPCRDCTFDAPNSYESLARQGCKEIPEHYSYAVLYWCVVSIDRLPVRSFQPSAGLQRPWSSNARWGVPAPTRFLPRTEYVRWFCTGYATATWGEPPDCCINDMRPTTPYMPLSSSL